MKRILLFLAIYLIAFKSFGQYCTVSAYQTCYEHISNVKFDTTNNTTGCTGAYADYTAVSFDISTGGIAYITVSNGQAFEANKCGIWVDWNNNQNFLDDPAITVSDKYDDVYYTAIIACPDNATLGPKRMRIRIVYEDAPKPCGSTSWGETEDYTINVVPAPEHDIAVESIMAPVSGPDLSTLENISVKFKNIGTSNEANVSVWYRINDGEKITETITGNLGSLQNTIFTFSVKANLSAPGTDYIIKAGVDLPGDNNSVNDSITISVRNTFGEHCAAGAYKGDEYISEVVHGDARKNSGWSDNGYADYTSSNSQIGIGGVEHITVYIQNGFLDDQCGIWIDWNDDADFTNDPHVTVTRVDEYEFTAAIQCPVGTELGDKRMRVRVMREGTLSPCGMSGNGEVEDYTINVTTASAHDMAVVSLISPVSGYNLSNSEPITVKYKNVGTSTESNVRVRYYINDVANSVWDTIYGNIASLKDTVFTFRTNADLSTSGADYRIYAGLSLSIDEIGYNDNVSRNVRNLNGYYCFRGTSSDELFISSVLCGTIDNSDMEWTEYGYEYASMSTDIDIDSSEVITIYSEGGDADTKCGIWVDWNENWDFTDEDPIIVSGTPGAGPFTATIRCPEGTELGQKRMRIRLYKGNISSPCGLYEFGETEDYTIKVIQLTVTPRYLITQKEAGSADFIVTSNIDWEASSDQAWCIVTPEGFDNDTITATYEENTSVSPRFATIKVEGSNANDQEVLLYQFGTAPSLVALPTVQNVDRLSGSIDYLILSNVDWTATSDQAWCTVTPSGTGVDSVTVTYTENTSVIERTANIFVTGPGDVKDTVVLRQAARPVSNILTPEMISGVIVYPNVGQGVFNIKMSGPESGKVTVRIINMQGAIVDELQFNKDSQSSIFNVTMSNAVKGLYLVQTVMNNYIDIQRIVVK